MKKPSGLCRARRNLCSITNVGAPHSYDACTWRGRDRLVLFDAHLCIRVGYRVNHPGGFLPKGELAVASIGGGNACFKRTVGLSRVAVDEPIAHSPSCFARSRTENDDLDDGVLRLHAVTLWFLKFMPLDLSENTLTLWLRAASVSHWRSNSSWIWPIGHFVCLSCSIVNVIRYSNAA